MASGKESNGGGKSGKSPSVLDKREQRRLQQDLQKEQAKADKLAGASSDGKKEESKTQDVKEDKARGADKEDADASSQFAEMREPQETYLTLNNSRSGTPKPQASFGQKPGEPLQGSANLRFLNVGRILSLTFYRKGEKQQSRPYPCYDGRR